ncbi:MAG: metallophosphoesterase [Phormidesmis sp.]
MIFPSSFAHGPSTLAKQVQWQHPQAVRGNIDQTQVAIAGAPVAPSAFSFLVMGDTDAGSLTAGSASDFSTAFAEQLMQQLGKSQFLIHTGDVTYPIGSYQNYWTGFLRPYQALLSRLPRPGYSAESVVFNRPLLPVPGNHDYAELGAKAQLWQWLLQGMCDRLRKVGIDWGHYGGQGGEAYGQTFLDDLARLSPQQLTSHLATHYSASTSDSEQYCLNYQPGQFTRLPNRYYRYRYGGVDFFALDSNSWNTDDRAKGFDHEQLNWLEQSLIASWQTPGTVGRIIYLHHSPYTTEESRWQQPETLWVRRHLRSLLNRVAAAIEQPASGSGFVPPKGPLVNLVISGHAHCLEHVQTAQTGHADAHLDWIICGGSGVDVRRQRQAGADILEKLSRAGRSRTDVVATSRLYAGMQGRRRQPQPFHSFLRIDVRPHALQQFSVCPYIVSHCPEGWQTEALTPLGIGQLLPAMYAMERAS